MDALHPKETQPENTCMSCIDNQGTLENITDFYFKNNKYVIGNSLGTGTAGAIREYNQDGTGTDNDDLSTKLAVKRFYRPDDYNHEKNSSRKLNKLLLKYKDNENPLNVIGPIYYSEKCSRIILPVKLGNLNDLAKKEIIDKQAVFIKCYTDVVSSIIQLVNEDAYYSDLKPENILYDKNVNGSYNFYIADIGGFVFSINQLKQADQAEKLNELKVAVGLATTYRKSKLDDLNKARQAAQEAEEAEEAAEVEAANIEIKTTELAVKEAEKALYAAHAAYTQAATHSASNYEKPFASQKGTFNCSYYYEPFNINDIEQEHIFKNQYFIANFIQQIVTFGIRCLLYFHKPPPGINEDIINALCPPAGRLSPPAHHSSAPTQDLPMGRDG